MKDKKDDRAKRFQWSEGDFTIIPAEEVQKRKPSKKGAKRVESKAADTHGSQDGPAEKE